MARICRLIATGQLLEYQSAGAEGALVRNAVSAGYALADIEEVVVTPAEWAAIREQWIDAPRLAQLAALEVQRKAKETAIKSKLKLSDADWQNLRDAVRGLNG